jgi:hypothetical protein
MSYFPFWSGLLPVTYGALRSHNGYEDRSSLFVFTALTSTVSLLHAYTTTDIPHARQYQQIPFGTRLLAFGLVASVTVGTNLVAQCIGDQLAHAYQPKKRELQ